MYELVYYFIEGIEIILFSKGIVRLELCKNSIRRLAAIVIFVVGAFIYAFYPNDSIKMICGMIFCHMVGIVLLFEVSFVKGLIKCLFSSVYISFLHLPIRVFGELLDIEFKNNISWTVSIVAICLISHYLNKRKEVIAWIKSIPIAYFCLAIICGITATGIASYIDYISKDSNLAVRNVLNVLSIISTTSLYIVGVAFSIVDVLRRQYKRENELKDDCLRMANEYYDALAAHLREVRSIKHDINSHINIISRYSEDESWDNLKKYLAEMKERQYTGEQIINVGNMIVSAILTDGVRNIANEENISIICKGSVPEELLISNYDLSVVLSNLLSNSIEACRRLQKDERKIHIEFSVVKKSMVIIFENPVERYIDVSKLGGGYTSKEDGERHGYGIDNIRKAVERCDGDMKLSAENGVFRTKIVFYKAVR